MIPTPVKKNWLIAFIADIKTAIVLIGLIVLFSIAGTVLPQGLRLWECVDKFGNVAGKLVFYSGLADIFHSWTFKILLGLLCLSIVFCTWEKAVKSVVSVINPGSIFGKRPPGKEITLLSEGTPVENRTWVSKLLKGRNFQAVEALHEENPALQVTKNRICMLGNTLVHLSIILILIGGLWDSLAGNKSYLRIAEGARSRIPGVAGDLRLDRFETGVYSGTSIPSDFQSFVTVLENGKDTVKKEITMNHPFVWKGIKLYQSDFGVAPFIKQATVQVSKIGAPKPLNIQLKPGESATLDPEYKLTFIHYYANHKGSEIWGKDVMAVHSDPMLELEISRTGGGVWRMSLPFGKPATQIPGIPMKFKFAAGEPAFYSVLLAVKDPAWPLVMTGMIILCLGCVLIFFIQRITARIIFISDGDAGTRMLLQIFGNYRFSSRDEVLAKLTGLVGGN